MPVGSEQNLGPGMLQNTDDLILIGLAPPSSGYAADGMMGIFRPRSTAGRGTS